MRRQSQTGDEGDGHNRTVEVVAQAIERGHCGRCRAKDDDNQGHPPGPGATPGQLPNQEQHQEHEGRVDVDRCRALDDPAK